MSKKIRIANLKFQEAVIEQLILRCWNDDINDPDDVMSEALDSIDPECSLSSNIEEVKQRGFIHKSDKTLEKDSKIEYEQAIQGLEGQLLQSLEPLYWCCACEPIMGETIFENRIDLVKHFFDKHGAVMAFKPKEPYNFEYIILKALVDKYVEIHKKYVSSKYFTMTCAGLYDILLWTLGFNKGDEYAPSNQTPTHILRNLGLLKKDNPREKKRMDRNSKGRIYHININDLEQAVFKTEFHDLKLILGQIDTNAVIQSVTKPPKPTIDENKDEEIPSVANGGNGGLDDEWKI